MTQIIIDSTADYSPEEAKSLGLIMLPLSIQFDQKLYRDRIDLTPEQFYELLAASEQLPTTSQPSPGSIMEAIESCPNEDIVIIPLSRTLSSTYENAMMVKEMSGREDIYICDTNWITFGLRMLVDDAIKMRDAGKSGAEIKEYIEKERDYIHLFAVLDTLDNMVKGGRISRAAFVAGKVLNIKPIVTFDQGIITVPSKARGRKGAIKEILKLMKQAGEPDLEYGCYIGYSGHKEHLEDFTDPILQEYPFKVLGEGYVSATLGTHVGNGGRAFIYKVKHD
jgi:DegV family protein with EDD domain